MGDTGANMSPWGGVYMSGGGAPATTEATVVTAAVAAGGSVSSPTSGGSGGGSPTRAQQPGVGRVEGGRVGKPARRRSRASRRAPVTLLNTDTSNFRAMVQQFTGIPSGPYGPAGPGGGPVISFGGGGGGAADYGPQLVRPSPTSAVMSFDHQLAAAAAHAQHRPTATSLQNQLFRPQHQQYGGDVGYGMMHGGGGDGMAPSFLHGGFESSSAEDRLLLQSMMQAAQTTMPTAGRPTSTNNGNGYNFG
ncbi:VQ motif-containing protein 22 [Sorghum bicolor]|uniref:VQ motif-containing protein 22 n=1 Tax=Sorghum bicolor TaxID=4558 RepID=UPI000B424D01|nr:VQ motif-containing protein 22 [Sorghum bicolor]|eukprot:XP_021314013.1 VQ motif-containing protein 22 [Sorghum bicolor]